MTFYSGFISCMSTSEMCKTERELNSFVEMEQIEKRRRFCAGGDFVSDIIIISFEMCFLKVFLVLIDQRESWSIVRDMKSRKKNFN